MPLTKDMTIDQVIHDFVHSTDERFAGKSKEERIKMAQGAYYSMQKEDTERATTSTLLSAIRDADNSAISAAVHDLMVARIAVRLEDMKSEIATSSFGL